MYKVKILAQADKDIRSYQKAGNKSALKKIKAIIKELETHPTKGIGQPENSNTNLLDIGVGELIKRTGSPIELMKIL